MQLNQQLLFFLASLGVFNGLLLAVYSCVVVKPLRWVNLLFSLLFLVLCVRVGKSIVHNFYDLERIWRQVGLSACVLIGPLLFTYVRAFQNNRLSPRRSDLGNLLLPLLGVLLVGFTWPYEAFPDKWDGWIVHCIYLVWIGYTLLAINEVRPLIKKAIQRQKMSISSTWLLLLVGALTLLCLAYNLALYGFPYLIGPLLFSVIFYLLIGFLVNKERGKVIFHGEQVKYRQPIDVTKANELVDQLANVMSQQKLFLNPKVKLADIATVIGTSSHELSRVINERLGITYNQYINQLRVEAACDLLKEADHLTIEGIGQEVGFTSRSAFYQSFKAFKEETPARYKARFTAHT